MDFSAHHFCRKERADFVVISFKKGDCKDKRMKKMENIYCKILTSNALCFILFLRRPSMQIAVIIALRCATQMHRRRHAGKKGGEHDTGDIGVEFDLKIREVNR